MGTLRSGLEEYRSTDLATCSDAEIEDDVCEMRAAVGGLSAEIARRVAELERRKTYERNGHLSITSWVESRFGVGWSEASREVALARGLEHMPAVREALAGGEVSASVVGTLVGAREANPSEFSRSEEVLLDAARTLPLRELRGAVERWRSQVEPDQVVRSDAERYERRGLSVTPGPDRMVRVEGTLDPETGTTVMTALSAVTGGWARSGSADPRTPAQRRADALGEVCRGYLDRPDRPVIGGERPHLSVVVDLATLEGRSGRPGRGPVRAEGPSATPHRTGVATQTSEGTVLPSETVRRLACDAAVSRVVTGGASQPLEVGRTTRVVSPALRRALVVRDSGCAFPGCDRPPGWCDAHHVRHWADGGRTDLGNLVLLCRRHHTMTHSGFGIDMVEGRPMFRRPDGTVLEDRGVAGVGARPRDPNRLGLEDRAPP